MENNLLKVRMFGGFSLEFNDKEVVLDRNAVSKTMQLLQLILLHSQDGAPFFPSGEMPQMQTDGLEALIK